MGGVSGLRFNAGLTRLHESDGRSGRVSEYIAKGKRKGKGSSVGRISEWEGLRSRRRRRRGDEVWGGGVPLPTGEGSGKGAVPPPQKKNLHFLHQNHTSVMHSDTLLK